MEEMFYALCIVGWLIAITEGLWIIGLRRQVKFHHWRGDFYRDRFEAMADNATRAAHDDGEVPRPHYHEEEP